MKYEAIETHINGIARSAAALEVVIDDVDKIKVLQEMLHSFHYGQREIIKALNELQFHGAGK